MNKIVRETDRERVPQLIAWLALLAGATGAILRVAGPGPSRPAGHVLLDLGTVLLALAVGIRAAWIRPEVHGRRVRLVGLAGFFGFLVQSVGFILKDLGVLGWDQITFFVLDAIVVIVGITASLWPGFWPGWRWRRLAR
jgi:hypothetical protein